MIYKDEIDYNIDQIKMKQGSFYLMASESLACDLYPHVKNKITDISLL